MTAVISKPQWLLIIASVVIVLLLNAIGMWEKFLFYEWRQMELPDLYKSYGCGNPWPKTIPETIVITVLLLAIGWLSVYMSGRPFFQELPLKLKYVGKLLTAILVGFIFMIISVSFSSMWLLDFWCGPLLGLDRSSLVIYWSVRLVFPATSILIFWAIYLSNPHRKTNQKTESVVPKK